jgi:hypothetical protein
MLLRRLSIECSRGEEWVSIDPTEASVRGGAPRWQLPNQNVPRTETEPGDTFRAVLRDLPLSVK